ncbi:hypothetical protein ACTMTI_37160 [Nonomuraea sp. H19]|uniref:hypothetical protein n=1 Tax=Nonomuraea sp. H19 TaxID=3452206 RepID=UPI003F8B77F1
MSAHKIRGIIAVAAVTAGVSWLAPGPAMAETCADDQRALLSNTSIASYCDERSGMRLDVGGPGAGRAVTSESSRLAMTAGTMARQLGLTGLATAKEAMGTADLGGIAANWGMPALASASPALFPALPDPAGMKDLATMITVPALSALPPTPLESQVSSQLSLDDGPHHDRVAGSGVKSPLDLQKPVQEVSADVIGVLLPEVVERVGHTSVLPDGQPVAAGFDGLVHGLGVR